MDISTALTSISIAKDFAALVLSRKIDSAVTDKAIELQGAIIGLQSTLLEIQIENQSLIDEKNTLKQQLLEMENWNSDAANYELKEIASGVFVYSVKLNQAAAIPNHWLCANCYYEKKKSILQRANQSMVGTEYFCPRCNSKFLDHSGCTEIKL